MHMCTGVLHMISIFLNFQGKLQRANIIFASVSPPALWRFLEKAMPTMMPTWEKRRSTAADDG